MTSKSRSKNITTYFAAFSLSSSPRRYILLQIKVFMGLSSKYHLCATWIFLHHAPHWPYSSDLLLCQCHKHLLLFLGTLARSYPHLTPLSILLKTLFMFAPTPPSRGSNIYHLLKRLTLWKSFCETII
jgi:hypothetical protein